MKTKKKSYFKIMLVVMLLMFVSVLNVEANVRTKLGLNSIYTFADTDILATRINIQNIAGENTIVLPSSVSPKSVVLYSDIPESSNMWLVSEKGRTKFFNGINLDLTQFCTGEDYSVKLAYSANGIPFEYEIRFLFSENIPAIYLVSDNPSQNGRLWVEASPDKSNKATGAMVMQKSDGELVYNGALTQIKGRGNSTWSAEKRPYQIKTEDKVDLLETNNPENKSKTWVLLANYFDPALIRNTLALNLGSALGMNVNIENTHVDLYYDGEYRGNYLLAEKVEVGRGRVDIEDLEEKNTELNGEDATENVLINTAKTANGATFTYCDGLLSPQDISGGYLIEMDYAERALEEICYFCTKRGKYVVVKSPEYATKEEMEYIASLYQDYEDAVYNGGINPKTGKAYSDYVDARSIACYYLVNEFSKARDCFSSSAYLYKNAGEDKMYMGPLWDYDLSLGKSNYEAEGDESPSGMSPYSTEMGLKLLGIPDFCELVKDIYSDEFYPLIKDVMLSKIDYVNKNSALQSVLHESNLVGASAVINAKLWHQDTDWNREIENLEYFIDCRADALNEIFSSHSFENPYWDVTISEWYYPYVVTATEYGYMSGQDNGFFKPDSGVRRSEIAQALYNITTVPNIIFEQRFSDVRADSWYADAVIWAASSGIISGYPNGKFRPDDYITREELALYLYRYARSPEIKSRFLDWFKDAGYVSYEARNAVEWAISEGILNGDSNRIYPRAYLTRAELAAILVRFNTRI